MPVPTVARLAGPLMPLLWAAAASAQTAPAPPRLDLQPATAAVQASPPAAPASGPAPADARARAAGADLRACTPDAPAAATARGGARPPAAAPRPPVVERLPGGRDSGSTSEPAIECLVVTDADGTRIEELRVRGRTERLVVHPRDGGRPYEIRTMDPGQDPGAKSGPGRGSAGQRVWPVLSF